MSVLFLTSETQADADLAKEGWGMPAEVRDVAKDEDEHVETNTHTLL